MKQKLLYITVVLCACCFFWGIALAGTGNPSKNSPETGKDKKIALLQGRLDELAGKIKIADRFISRASLVQMDSSAMLGILNEVRGGLEGVFSKDQWENRIIPKTHDTGFISSCNNFKKNIDGLVGAGPPEDLLKNIKELSSAMETAVAAVALFGKTVGMKSAQVLERLEQEKSPVMDLPEIRAKDNNAIKEAIIVMTRAGWLEKSIEPARNALLGFEDKLSKTVRAVQFLSLSWREKSVLTEFEIQQAKMTEL
ncbi:MAG: hypothetical protein L3J03_05530 [Desulfobacterales bacterium]|nr:hypothetical protein [Desulfobacterales bacterium]